MIITMLHVVVGELAPKSAAIARTPPIVLALTPVMRMFYVATKPLVEALNWLGNLVLKPFGIPPASEAGSQPHSEDELRLLLRESSREGTIGPRGAGAVRGRARLRRPPRPRGDEAARRDRLRAHDRLAAPVAERVIETGHTRLPLCEPDGGLDAAVGVINAKDLLPVGAAPDATSTCARSRGRSRTSPSRPASIASCATCAATAATSASCTTSTARSSASSRSRTSSRRSSARSRTSSTPRSRTPIRTEDGVVLIDGAAPAREVAERLGFDLDAHHETTIGGYLSEELGRVPRAGEEIELHGWRFEVRQRRGHARDRARRRAGALAASGRRRRAGARRRRRLTGLDERELLGPGERLDPRLLAARGACGRASAARARAPPAGGCACRRSRCRPRGGRSGARGRRSSPCRASRRRSAAGRPRRSRVAASPAARRAPPRSALRARRAGGGARPRRRARRRSGGPGPRGPSRRSRRAGTPGRRPRRRARRCRRRRRSVRGGGRSGPRRGRRRSRAARRRRRRSPARRSPARARRARAVRRAHRAGPVAPPAVRPRADHVHAVDEPTAAGPSRRDHPTSLEGSVFRQPVHQRGASCETRVHGRVPQVWAGRRGGGQVLLRLRVVAGGPRRGRPARPQDRHACVRRRQRLHRARRPPGPRGPAARDDAVLRRDARRHRAPRRDRREVHRRRGHGGVRRARPARGRRRARRARRARDARGARRPQRRPRRVAGTSGSSPTPGVNTGEVAVRHDARGRAVHARRPGQRRPAPRVGGRPGRDPHRPDHRAAAARERAPRARSSRCA